MKQDFRCNVYVAGGTLQLCLCALTELCSLFPWCPCSARAALCAVRTALLLCALRADSQDANTCSTAVPAVCLFLFAAARKACSSNPASFEEVTQEAPWPLKVSASMGCIFRLCVQKTTVLCISSYQQSDEMSVSS